MAKERKLSREADQLSICCNVPAYHQKRLRTSYLSTTNIERKKQIILYECKDVYFL